MRGRPPEVFHTWLSEYLDKLNKQFKSDLKQFENEVLGKFPKES